jgi:hypothetical protein
METFNFLTLTVLLATLLKPMVLASCLLLPLVVAFSLYRYSQLVEHGQNLPGSQRLKSQSLAVAAVAVALLTLLIGALQVGLAAVRR